MKGLEKIRLDFYRQRCRAIKKAKRQANEKAAKQGTKVSQS
jgi:hypothetical protein